tara:strand:+ start:285 stop:539 length:255 start_codon:yes stop_codon:yes gene_type:complete
VTYRLQLCEREKKNTMKTKKTYYCLKPRQFRILTIPGKSEDVAHRWQIEYRESENRLITMHAIHCAHMRFLEDLFKEAGYKRVA